ncbi:MAG: hypothetical protein ABI835_21385, partial [Chloroflexota bacterium]
VTAYAMVGDRERCIEAGCDSYLSKPLPVAELVEMVQMYEQKYKQPSVPIVTAAPVVPAAPVVAAAPANGDKESVEAPTPKAEEVAVKPAVSPISEAAPDSMAESTDKRTEEPTEPSRDANLDLAASRSSNHAADPAAQGGSVQA